MHLKELKTKSPAQLVEMAEELGVEGASTLRKQDLMFSILKELSLIHIWNDRNIGRLVSPIRQIDARRRFGGSRYAGEDDVGLFPIFPADPVVMCDGELDRLDAREIGGIERMLTARSRLGFLPEHARQGVGYRVERGNKRQALSLGAALETCAQLTVDEGERCV